MEAQWIADRATLRALAQTHPDWGPKELAESVGRSLSWAKKGGVSALTGPGSMIRSSSTPARVPITRPPVRCRKRSSSAFWRFVRNHRRTSTGRLVPKPSSPPCALTRREPRWARHCPGRAAPSGGSCAAQGCILDAPARRRRPLELAEPMTNSELDFTDESRVPSKPLGKKQHGAESFKAIDAGTSTWLFTQVRADFNAETARFSVIEVFSQYGCPKPLTSSPRPTLDRGPTDAHVSLRPMSRMLVCLGITPHLCPPRAS